MLLPLRSQPNRQQSLASPIDGAFGTADDALNTYRQLYGVATTAADVFFAVYGLLHSEDHRREFAADLKKMLPSGLRTAGSPSTLAGGGIDELFIGGLRGRRPGCAIVGASTIGQMVC